MINPHGINGVLGKGWCPKKEKRTRKAVVPSSEKEKRLSERNENSCKFVCLYSSLLIITNYFRSFVSRARGKAQDDRSDIVCLNRQIYFSVILTRLKKMGYGRIWKIYLHCLNPKTLFGIFQKPGRRVGSKWQKGLLNNLENFISDPSRVGLRGKAQNDKKVCV